MDEETTIDVKEADETTASASSNAEETTTETTPDEGQGDNKNAEVLADGTPVDQKTVPYKVFADANTKLAEATKKLEEVAAKMGSNATPAAPIDPAEAKQKEAIKQALEPMLKEMGYVSKDELRRQKADEQLETSLKSLEDKYSGKDNPELKFVRDEVINFAIENGISNPEMAFKIMKEKEFANFLIQQAGSKSQGLQTEGSNGSGSQSVGNSDDDLKAAAAKGDKKAKDILLSRIAKKAFQ